MWYVHFLGYRYYGKTYKVTNTLKLNGIGLKNSSEEEIKIFLSKFDLNCMVYLIDNEDIIYIEFHRKKECSYLFNLLNNVMIYNEIHKTMLFPVYIYTFVEI